MDKYKLNIEGQSFELTAAEVHKLDVSKSDETYHAISEGQTYKARLISISGKHVSLEVNNNIYELQISDPTDQLVENMGLNAIPEILMNDVKAPMPGLILDIMVEAGQEVAAGDPLLVLEAMKMENVIKAVGSGTVKEVLLNSGTTVEKNQVIIEMV